MKRLLAISMLFGLTGCLGHSSTGNEVIGQVKRVQHKTPLLCPDYAHVDISMGTMRNGVGSMSTQDIWLWIQNPADIALLEGAARDGKIVKINYDVARSRWFNCVEHEELTRVEVLP